MFASDNWSGAHPAVSENLARHAEGFAAAYGTSELDRAVEARFDEIFEREVSVWFVATGTAANAMALAAVNRPGGFAFCHSEAHVIESECGAVEYATHGARLVPIDGTLGRIDPARLDEEMGRLAPMRVHAGQPMAVTITQGTEVGTHYELDDIRRIAEVCRRHEVPLHMDGARFANALVATGLSPAEMTWKTGVDILSFGGTKNGCWCAEALVFLDPARAEHIGFIRKRSAQLFSKTRFVAAQFEAYLADDLWLRTARHANGVADALKGALRESGARLAWETTTNEVFAYLTATQIAQLEARGIHCHGWPMPRNAPSSPREGETLQRFVASFANTSEHVDALRGALRSGLATAA